MRASTIRGFGFTAIAAAAGIASGNAALTAFAFAVTGLGWWLLMRQNMLDIHAVAADLEAAAVERAARARSSAMVREYFAECRGQSSSSRGELSQLQRLLQDAILRLTAGFSAMQALAQQQRSLALELSGAAADPTRTGDDAPQASQSMTDKVKVLAGVTEEFSHSANQAVISLQFQDISRQLLDHASERLAALEEMGQSVEALVRAEGIVEEPVLASLIAESERALASARRRTSRGPIGQEAMQGGAVELF